MYDHYEGLLIFFFRESYAVLLTDPPKYTYCGISIWLDLTTPWHCGICGVGSNYWCVCVCVCVSGLKAWNHWKNLKVHQVYARKLIENPRRVHLFPIPVARRIGVLESLFLEYIIYLCWWAQVFIAIFCNWIAWYYLMWHVFCAWCWAYANMIMGSRHQSWKWWWWWCRPSLSLSRYHVYLDVWICTWHRFDR